MDNFTWVDIYAYIISPFQGFWGTFHHYRIKSKNMKKEYNIPKLRVKVIAPSLLVIDSEIQAGGKGRLDAKDYSAYFNNEDE